MPYDHDVDYPAEQAELDADIQAAAEAFENDQSLENMQALEAAHVRRQENLRLLVDFRQHRRMTRALNYVQTNPDPNRRRLLRILRGEIDS